MQLEVFRMRGHWCVCFLWLSILGCGIEPVAESPPQGEHDPRPEPKRKIEVAVPGIRNPVIVPAAEATLADDEEVIGVRVEDHYRAYRLKAFEAGGIPMDQAESSQFKRLLRRHVVNDQLGSVSFAVAHCDMSKCTRVLLTDSAKPATDGESPQPLRVGIGGLDQESNQMVLLIEGQRYPQTSKDLPLTDHDFQVVTWGEWKQAHPTTDVYLGQPELKTGAL